MHEADALRVAAGHANDLVMDVARVVPFRILKAVLLVVRIEMGTS